MLQGLDRNRQELNLPFTDQQVHVLGHYDAAGDDKIVVNTRSVATESNEAQMMTLLLAV